MKVAVYNRHWSTAGGGERYAGAFGQALSSEHDVDLLAQDDVNWRTLEERLGLDLSGTTRVRIREGELTASSQRYDLLVNCSYMSADPCGARHGIYVVLFPTPFDQDVSRKKRLALQAFGRYAENRAATIEYGSGFHLPESSRRHRYRWTTGDARLLVRAPEGAVVSMTILLGPRPPGTEGTDVQITIDGTATTAGRVEVSGQTRLDAQLTGRGPQAPVEVGIRSDVFVPSETLGTPDHRSLGVQLRGLRTGGGPGAALATRWPWLATPLPTLGFLSTYDRVVSISEYTASSVQRSWGVESDVLYPPVQAVAPARKDPLILAVGRFFDRTAGHSKKQLELVRAFRALAPNLDSDWELHLAGGCSPEHRPYLDRVRAETEGLAVTIHVDASGAALRDLYGRASVFWHGTGLGESRRWHPHRFEHFGITTVEAMSAGAVPVVVDGGGQPEIVAHGESGFLARSRREFVHRTRQLAGDERLRARMSDAARARAADFSYERFAAQARTLALSVADAGGGQASFDASGRRSARIESRNE